MLFSRNKVVVRNREDHSLSRKQIDPDALRVLYRLADAGFTAYLVGGSVRDLLLGRTPKDFDVGTDAHPAQIRKLFRNCYLIGRRFRLAHIIFGKKVIETSTFRRQPEAAEADEGVPGGLYQHEDNTFGTPEEDARRRDFTVNGLFYDIRTFSIIDYVGGLRDLETRTLRTIGDPNIRFREDPVRMMRAVRFAGRLDFRMDWSCRRAIRRHYGEIVHASKPRLLEEIMRLFGYCSAAPTFQLLWEHRLLSILLPEIDAHVERTGGAQAPIWKYLAALDQDADNAITSNALRLAALYMPLYQEAMREQLAKGHGHVNGLALARHVLDPLMTRLQIPKQAFYTACSLLDAQRQFEENISRHPRRMRTHHHDFFMEAVVLRRITLTATGQSVSSLQEWEPLAAQHPPSGMPSLHASVEDQNIGHPEDQVPPLSDDASLPRPKRRRRRRRHSRHLPQQNQQSPSEHAPSVASPSLPAAPSSASHAPAAQTPNLPAGEDSARPADAG